MAIVIPDEILHAAHMTETEMAGALAVALFQQEKLTLGQAAPPGRHEPVGLPWPSCRPGHSTSLRRCGL